MMISFWFQFICWCTILHERHFGKYVEAYKVRGVLGEGAHTWLDVGTYSMKEVGNGISFGISFSDPISFFKPKAVGGKIPMTIPFVLWHGLDGATVYMKRKARMIRIRFPGAYVVVIGIGDDSKKQGKNSIWMEPSKQVDLACETIENDKLLTAYGFNAIGESQGGLLLRAVIERCGHRFTVHNLLTLGSPHQGNYGVPLDNAFVPKKLLHAVARCAAKSKLIQNHVCPAAYWHDPDEKTYEKYNGFLAEINNARAHDLSELYKKRIKALKKFVMVKFNNDTVLNPPESAWFEFYGPKEGKTRRIIPLRDSDLYKQDRLGLRELDQTGRLVLRSFDTEHVGISLLQFSELLAEFENSTVQVSDTEWDEYNQKGDENIKLLAQQL